MACGITIGLFPGCGSDESRSTPVGALTAGPQLTGASSGPLQITPRPRRVDAIAGSTLVVPVEVGGNLPTDGRVQAVLDDTRALAARLWWIGLDPRSTIGGEWLSDEGRWHALTPSQARGSGFWALVIELPVDGGGGLWVQGQRWAVQWWPTPEALVREDQAWAAWEPPEMAISGRIGERLLIPELQSPVRRWRAELATRGLRPRSAEADAASTGTIAPDTAEGVLEAFAGQRRTLWQLALARLWHDDRALERRLVEALTRTADMGRGVRAPVWRTDSVALDALLDALLDPEGRAASRADAAKLFIDEAPIAAAWIEDDAGAAPRVGEGQPALEVADQARAVATVGVANLTGQEALAWAREPGATEPQVAATPPWGSTLLRVELHSAEAVRVGCGRWESLLPVERGALRARPPGAALGPLLHDWTLDGWITGNERAGALPVHGATGALLYLDRGLWTMYIECATSSSALSEVGATDLVGESPDRVRVWLGPRGAPHAIIAVDATGALRDELGGLAELPTRVAVDTRDDRWAVHIPIPGSVIGTDPARGAELLIGLERLGATGARTAWPRRMLPWQTEPARRRIDLGAWTSDE